MKEQTKREIIQIVDKCQIALTDIKDYINGDNFVGALYNLNRVFDNIAKSVILTRTILPFNQNIPI